MAKDKKGFIVYTSWKNAVTDMSDEEAGQFFKWMLDYTNDKWNSTQEVEYPDNRFVKQMCKMVMPILKEDLKKYERKVENFKRIGKQFKNNGAEIDTDNGAEIESKSVPSENCYGGDKDKVKDKVKVKDKDINILKESIKEKDEPDVSSCTSTSEEKISKHKFGSFQTILLTDDEFSKLCSEFGKSYILEVIERLDEYKKMNGNKNKWKVDNLVIRKAIRENWSLIRNIDVESLKKRDMELETSLDDESLQVLEGLEI